MDASLLREAALSFIYYLPGVWIELYRSGLPDSAPVMYSRGDREHATSIARGRSIICSLVEHERIGFEPQ